MAINLDPEVVKGVIDKNTINFDAVAKGVGGSIASATAMGIANTQNIDNTNNITNFQAGEVYGYTGASQYNQPVNTDALNELLMSGFNSGIKAGTDIVQMRLDQMDTISKTVLDSANMYVQNEQFNKSMELENKKFNQSLVEFEYGKSRDTVGDKQWQKEFNENQRQFDAKMKEDMRQFEASLAQDERAYQAQQARASAERTNPYAGLSDAARLLLQQEQNTQSKLSSNKGKAVGPVGPMDPNNFPTNIASGPGGSLVTYRDGTVKKYKPGSVEYDSYAKMQNDGYNNMKIAEKNSYYNNMIGISK